jgi:integrase
MRRSELVALDVADLEFSAEGVRVTIRRSKTDQLGSGDTIGILSSGSPTCPVAALQRWIEAAGLVEGRVFRRVDRHGRVGLSLSPEAVAIIVRRRAMMANLDAAAQWSGHSLRAGMATSAAALARLREPSGD